MTPAWQRKEGQNPEGGLNAKGRRLLERYSLMDVKEHGGPEDE